MNEEQLKAVGPMAASLIPFAKWWEEAVDNTAPAALQAQDACPIAYDGRYHGPTYGDCRLAAEALAAWAKTRLDASAVKE